MKQFLSKIKIFTISSSLSYFDYFLFFIYAFLSTFEEYFIPYIGNITKYIMILIIIVFLIKDVISRSFTINITSLSLLLWLGIKFMSIFIGGYNSIIQLHLISQIGFVFFLFILCGRNYKKHEAKIILFIFWFVSILFNLLTVFLHKPYLGLYTSRNVLTLFGIQNDPNNCATFSLVSVALSLYYIFYEKKFYIVNTVSVLLGSLAILLSGSRAGLISVIILILCCLFLRRPYDLSTFLFRLSIVSLSSLVVVIGLFFILPKNTFIRLFITSYSGGSDRIILWQKAFKLFKTSPIFGAGWGTATFFEKQFPTAVHNTFLSMLAEGGMIAIVLFLFPICNLLNTSFKRKDISIILVLIIACVPAFFIDSINKRFIWNGILLAFIISNSYCFFTKSKEIQTIQDDQQEEYYMVEV